MKMNTEGRNRAMKSVDISRSMCDSRSREASKKLNHPEAHYLFKRKKGNTLKFVLEEEYLNDDINVVES